MANNQGNNRQQVARRDDKAVSTIVSKAQQEFSLIAQSDKLVEWAREAAYARQIILNDEYLVQANEQSVVNAVVNIANVGLTLAPVTQFCALIARYDKKLGGYVASLMVMYKGLIKLATDVGLTSLIVENVYDKDEFEYGVGDQGEYVTYRKNVRTEQGTEDNPYIGTFVRATFRDYAGVFIEFVTVEDMHKIRSQSDAYDEAKPYCVWIKWFGEQARKSALKRAQKRWPKTSSKAWERLDKAIAIDNEVEGAKLKARENRENAVDAETVEKTNITQEQAGEIYELCLASGVSPYRLGMAYDLKVDKDGTGLAGFTTDQYDEVIERLNTALEEKKKRAQP